MRAAARSFRGAILIGARRSGVRLADTRPYERMGERLVVATMALFDVTEDAARELVAWQFACERWSGWFEEPRPYHEWFHRITLYFEGHLARHDEPLALVPGGLGVVPTMSPSPANDAEVAQ